MKRALFLLLLLFGSQPAFASPYTLQPDGSVTFDAEITTSGFFSCTNVLVDCALTNSNQSVTIVNGLYDATFTFVGTDQSIGITNQAQPVTLGYIEAIADPEFTFPFFPLQPNLGLFSMSLVISDTNLGIGGSRLLQFGLGGAGGTEISTHILGGIDIVMPLLAGTNPPGSNYRFIVYALDYPADSLSTTGTTTFGATVSAVPESASVLLVGGGFAALWARRKRNGSRR